MDVSIIMINYNTYDLTKNALQSIMDYTESINYEILLIDNLSTDGSGEKLNNLFGKKIVYIQSGGNLGTSKAFNLGLSKAKGKYVLWLNTDIIIKENFVKKLFDFMESNPQCGICGGNILNFRGRPTTSYDMKLFCGNTTKKQAKLINMILSVVFKKSLSLHYNYKGHPILVGGIIGCDMMIRKKLFDMVGAFDENIFMYGEETEFNYRVTHQTEYTTMSVPNAQIYHLEGGSIANSNRVFNKKKEFIVIQGELTYVKKWYGKEDVRLVLKSWIKESKYKSFMCVLLRKKERAAYFKEKTRFLRDTLNNLDEFYNNLNTPCFAKVNN